VKIEVERWLGRGRGNEMEMARETSVVISDGGPSAGEVVTSQRLRITLFAGWLDPIGVIEIRHRGVDVAETKGDVDCIEFMAMLHARIKFALLRQHDISAHLNCSGAAESKASTALAHGSAAADAPTHRTLTCARAIDGAIACIVIATAMISQSIL